MSISETVEALGTAIRVQSLADGQLWRVWLNRPKGNVLDAEMVGALKEVFDRARTEQNLKLITLEGEGKHFSFGASVEEHLPDQCAAMLSGFHAMFYRLHASHVLCHAVVRGQCLGGGLELASFCHRVYATPDSHHGQPEIALGVIAPVATVTLTSRVGRGAAEDLCLSGRVVDGQEALRMGLVDVLDEDPWGACQNYFEQFIAARSASSLRFAVRAMRLEFGRDLERRVRELEGLYNRELMTTHDAVEGISAFVEKRKPEWRNE